MKWNYRCPKCSQWRHVKWEERNSSFTCDKTKQSYTPPSPTDQHDAYVDTHEWPQEMEDTVIEVKGNKCSVPGCDKYYETLDHRVPWSKKGRTSVENLYPMCTAHNQSKGDSDYDLWVVTQV